MAQKKPDGEKKVEKGRRQFVRFAFYKIASDWRRLAHEEQEKGKKAFCQVIDSFGDRLLVRSYSLVGMRGDADLLLWQIGDRLEDLQELTTQLFQTEIGPYLSLPYSYLAMTRRSQYVSAEEAETRLVIQPSEAKYLFVYPFVKTRPWYALAKEERQRLMNHHISTGRKYPSIKLNTTYSFGLDDQEFVVAFEGDDPSDFLDLVMELRESETSMYTLKDTPVFTCISMELMAALDTLGAPGDRFAASTNISTVSGGTWVQVAALEAIPDGDSMTVYFQGDQIALFNVGGEIFAIDNRCSHANGPLADGQIEDGSVSCPWHGSRFDLRSGNSIQGPAGRRVSSYEVKLEGGNIFLIGKESSANPEVSTKC